jgi:hypothetical protein
MRFINITVVTDVFGAFNETIEQQSDGICTSESNARGKVETEQKNRHRTRPAFANRACSET